MKSFIFVCTGNTCRSPMAQAILKKKLWLADVKNVKVASAGISAAKNSAVNVNAVKALALLGLKATGLKPKQLTAEMLKKYDLIVVMTDAHKQALKNYPNVYTFDELTGCGEIDDPYGKDLKAYTETARQLEQACNALLEKFILGEMI